MSSGLEQTTSDIESVDIQGRTPLILAALRGHIPAIKDLHSQGANLNAQCYSHDHTRQESDKIYNTPLIWAIANANIEAAKILVNLGANLDVIARSAHEEGHSDTALILAVSKGYNHKDDKYPETSPPMSQIIDLLIAKGADVNIQDSNGRTALHYAVLHREEKLIGNLLSAGADPSITDTTGQTPMDLLKIPYEEVKYILNRAAAVYSLSDLEIWQTKEATVKPLLERPILPRTPALQLAEIAQGLSNIAVSPSPTPSPLPITTASKISRILL